MFSSFSEVERHMNHSGSFELLSRNKCEQDQEAPLCGNNGKYCVQKKYVGVMKVCDELFLPVRRLFRVISVPEILRDYQVDFGNAAAGTGKSGASFQFLGTRYILKEMTTSDMAIMTDIAEDYTNHMVQNAQWTMMVRIYAILKADGKNWMLINNFLPVRFPATYDLKGSFHGRTGEGSSLKDNNWVEDEMKIKLDPSVRTRVLKALKEDAKFLGDRKLLDYSLIVGHREFRLPKCGPGNGFGSCVAPVCAKGMSCVDAADAVEAVGAMEGTEAHMGIKNSREWNCIGSFFCGQPEKDFEITGSPADGVGHNCIGTLVDDSGGEKHGSMTLHFYCFGIIDILKVWDNKAHLEYLAKKTYTNKASVQPPPEYKERFETFITEGIPNLWGVGKRVEFKPDKSYECPYLPQTCSAAIGCRTVGVIVFYMISGWTW